MAQANVTIYSTPTCHFCHMAKEFFRQNGIKYADINVASDWEKAQEMIAKSGQTGVPVIEINGRIIIGFDELEIREALGIK